MDAGHVSENALYSTFIQTSKLFKMESVEVCLKVSLTSAAHPMLFLRTFQRSWTLSAHAG